jgi:hypothetical protein
MFVFVLRKSSWYFHIHVGAMLLNGRQRSVTWPALESPLLQRRSADQHSLVILLFWLQETENTVGRLWGVAAVADAMRDLKSAAQGDSGQEGTWRDLGARKHIRGEQGRK